jgi:predicted alpha/beta hydrolase family esterase
VRKTIIIHGKTRKKDFYDPDSETPSNALWFPWLSRQLLAKDIFPIAPEIPSSWQPRYHLWEKELERFEIDEETDLVGHSCGGGFLVRWLGENPDVRCKKVILVAPWIDSNHEYDTADFFDFKIDSTIPERTEELVIYNSTDDDEGIHASVELIRKEIPEHTYREFKNVGHFASFKNHEFPELIEELVK